MIFHIKKLYVSISWCFFSMVFWVVLTNKIESFLICLLALTIHEIGHIVFIYLLKEKISIFYILPFGFCCRLRNQYSVSREKMIKILLAGPVTSILVAGFLFFWTRKFALVNFFIGVFNLLPVWYLDGGRVYFLFRK